MTDLFDRRSKLPRRQQNLPIDFDRRARYADRRVDIEDIALAQRARRRDDEIAAGERRLAWGFIIVGLTVVVGLLIALVVLP